MQNPNDAAEKPENEAQTKPLGGISTQITRRTLFGVAAGLAALRTACAETEPPTIASPVFGDEPGLLAKSLLNPDVVALMTGATHFCAMRGKEVEGHPKKGAKSSIIFSDMSPYEKRVFSFEAGIFRQTFYINYSPLFCQGLPYGEPTLPETVMARRLAVLLLRDELWTETDLSWRPGAIAFKPDFVFRFADEFPGVVVSVCPNAHQICIEWQNKSASRTSSILFDPIGEEMTAFIKEAFPSDADAQSLAFVPLPVPPPVPLPVRPPEFSQNAWDKIMALRPSMSRADLLQVFEEEGGMSSRSARIYNARNLHKTGLRLKVRAEFLPAGIALLWRNGKAFIRNAEDAPKTRGGRELPTDVISSLSPLYWGTFYGGA